MGYSAGQAFLAGVVPFIPVDLIKVALATALGTQIKRSLFKSGLLQPLFENDNLLKPAMKQARTK